MKFINIKIIKHSSLRGMLSYKIYVYLKYIISFILKRNIELTNHEIDTNLDLSPINADKINDLGLSYKNGKARFKIWVPVSKSKRKGNEVKINFYSCWDQSIDEPDETIDLKYLKNGTWYLEKEIEAGKFYQYQINGKPVLDPYAKSMAQFDHLGKDKIGKAAIVDVASIEPENGWYKEYKKPGNYSKREDAIIYEIHVRDFTIISKNIKNQPGTYKAFSERINYLKNLGITHIQLMPVLTYYFKSEQNNKIFEDTPNQTGYSNYNWGYDPHNYFTPEGMYSENPADPFLRIKELKTLINEIHKQGLGVILDVVYNHTANKDVFDNIVKDYYYRKTSNSGCGNDIESSNKMVRKLIIDSIKYWTKEYRVDGFRFDLMGLIDDKTIEDAYFEARKINKYTLFTGEGWRMWSGSNKDTTFNRIKPADQSNMLKMKNVSMFSDSYRNIFKGGGLTENRTGYLALQKEKAENIFSKIVARSHDFKTKNSLAWVNYLTCHDGLCLYDKISYSLNIDKNIENDNLVFDILKTAYVLLLTSQGVAFIHGGDEMGRTKEIPFAPSHHESVKSHNGRWFVFNSYSSSDQINKFDWNMLENNINSRKLYNYIKGLIKIRKETDAFKLVSKRKISKNVKLIDASHQHGVAYSARSTKKFKYFIFVNCDSKEIEFKTGEDLNNLDCIVDKNNADIIKINDPVGFSKLTNKKITIEPHSAIIFRKVI